MHNKIQLVVRILLGALFLFGGVAFFFTTPPPMTGDMATYFNGLAASHYFFYLLKGTEIFCGLCLLSGFFVPLALVILAPVALNIFLVHVFLEPSGIAMSMAICVAILYLAFFSPSYSAPIKRLFAMK
jgi:putative oxidoreductase